MSEISDFRQLAFELIDSILTVVKCYLHEVLACFR